MKNPYKILEITEDASSEEIRSAYLRLVKIYHPDKLNGNDDVFKDIQMAYEILSDERLKFNFDTYGDYKEDSYSKRYSDFIDSVIIPVILNTENVAETNVQTRIINEVKKIQKELNKNKRSILLNIEKLEKVSVRLTKINALDSVLRDSISKRIVSDKDVIKSIDFNLEFLLKCLDDIIEHEYHTDDVDRGIVFISSGETILNK